jgi:hypothetical protein
MKQIIDNMFDTISYWQDKKLLLSAIKPEYYQNMNLILRLLHISSASVSPKNEAKKDMWNHQIVRYNMGDDILKNISQNILDKKEFALMAISKYYRSYIYLSKRLQASRQLALLCVKYENGEHPTNQPILSYMPEIFREDQEISAMATVRNIENLRFAPKLRNNKYFILDVINLIYEDSVRLKVLEYMNQEFLNDKRFVSRLGCFEGLCEKFRGDELFVAYTVMDDINILKKVEIFSEKIITYALKNKEYKHDPQKVLIRIFKYIEKFNDNFEQLEEKIKNKKLLNRLFWELALVASDDFL